MATSKIPNRFPRIRNWYNVQSGGTYTTDVERGQYLIVITRLNGNGAAYYGGAYILSARDSGSTLSPIVEPAVATLSFSYPTLTLTTTQNYVQTSIIMLNDIG